MTRRTFKRAGVLAGAILAVGAAPLVAQETALPVRVSEDGFVRVVEVADRTPLARLGRGPFIVANSSPYADGGEEAFRYAAELPYLVEALGGQGRVAAVHYPANAYRNPDDRMYVPVAQRSAADDAILFPYLEMEGPKGRLFVSCGSLEARFDWCDQALRLGSAGVQVVSIEASPRRRTRAAALRGVVNGIGGSGGGGEREPIPSAFPRCPRDPRCE